ncbi:microsomal glutathione S-transferase 1-like [Uranotaenia lowii]|uniref:microsomal glutathione S-transferase 1-like n=1 Tax=Uranotaenia lowii TaxID=190385 RepID=UPI00247B05C2|nr:microsomal glutathione S-transferase 1-like [Uranotaenia lowii]
MVKLFDNINEEVYRSYIFWSTILVVKMLVMSVLTGLQRFRKKAFVNPEDIATMPKLKLKFDDPDVERVRRAHLNDLENILPFFLICFLYLLTGPNVTLAKNLIRAAAFGRILHSLVYAVIVIPQPARLLSFLLTLIITLYMLLQCVVYYF